MNKKTLGIMICFVGLVIVYGATRFLPDLKSLGFGVAFFLAGAIVAAAGFFNRAGNWKMWLGLVLFFWA